MSLINQNPNEADVHDKVLEAIRGALREEKEPKLKRIIKVLGATTLVSILFGLPFLISFRNQLTWVWTLALSFWVIYFAIGFSFIFKPQPRLMISGVWSPFVVARLFLVSTLTTIAQIIICPSFVFFDSPLGWNPLLPLTDSLMSMGGMNLCMGFCGFLFAVVAASLGIRSVYRVAKATSLKSNIVIFSILLVAQIPVILVQVLSEDLRPYSPIWIFGMILGFFVVLGSKLGWNKLSA